MEVKEQQKTEEISKRGEVIMRMRMRECMNRLLGEIDEGRIGGFWMQR